MALFSGAPQTCANPVRRQLRRLLLASGALAALAMGTVQAQAGDSEKAFIRNHTDPEVT